MSLAHSVFEGCPRYDWVCSSVSNGEDVTFSEIRSHLLRSRNVAPDAEAEFLDPDLRRDLTDPFQVFPEMEKAVEVIWNSIRNGETITVFSDYDADGVCAGAITIRVLRSLGASAESFIPDRKTEGFGISSAAAHRCLSEHPTAKLWITVDCGIAAAAELSAVRAQGVKVVVTDHHELTGERPQVEALINPHVECRDERAGDLCGAGVAFKLAQALVVAGKRNGYYAGDQMAGRLLPLAALATVADSVTLLGENRLIVSSALKRWSNVAPAGLRALHRAMTPRSEEVGARTLGFAYAPCINAAGRIASARRALDLLLEDDDEKANALALELVEYNEKRKECERRISQEAKECAKIEDADALKSLGAVVVCGNASFCLENGWHPGVIGIVASRICELTRLPTAIATLTSGTDEGRGHGSVRVPEGYDAMQALTESAEALETFGGHVSAAGFTILPGREQMFKDLFCASCRRQAERKGIPARAQLRIDFKLSAAHLTVEMGRSVDSLKPFGIGNPEPCWMMEGVRFANIEICGKLGSTLRFTVLKDSDSFQAVWFGASRHVEFIRSVGVADIAFSLACDTYGSYQGLKMMVIDVRAHGGEK